MEAGLTEPDPQDVEEKPYAEKIPWLSYDPIYKPHPHNVDYDIRVRNESLFSL